MQNVEKVIGLKISDFQDVGPTVTKAVTMAKNRYFKETPLKLQLLDNLILLAITTFVI